MKVHVSYTVDVGDDYRRAINHHYGKPGLATRDEVKSWLQANGSQGDTDLMWDLDNAERRAAEGNDDE